ncbi:Mdm33 family-domain-containing protein [Xylariales sp. PMI_506]|nr:Mdm33 family-domain-containing protein [Xylariales sp. PMI_506]
MAPSRIVRPILGATSRLLLREQCLTSPGPVTSSWKLSSAVLPQRDCRTSSRLQGKIASFTCTPHSQIRQYSSSDRRDPLGHPNFEHLRPKEDIPTPPSPRETAEEKPIELSSPTGSPSSAADSPAGSPAPDAAASPSPDPIADADPASPLPSQAESRRSALSARFNEFMDRAQSSLFVASQRINDLTGYSGIEALKEQIATLETSLADAQAALHAARSAYKTKVADRAATQREVTTLLARQKTWTPADFERFTTLYRSDYELEVEVADRARQLEEAEREAERLSRELSTGILARYHEEQIWSDKIRRMSTWGTWGLMGVNVLLFLVFQFGAEPWRRARLVKGFEDKVHEALEKHRQHDRAIREEERAATAAAATAAVAETLTAASQTLGDAAPAAEISAAAETEPIALQDGLSDGWKPALSWRAGLTDPAWWRESVVDLTSERKIALRVRDVSLVAVEAAAAGAMMAGTIAVLLLRRS